MNYVIEKQVTNKYEVIDMVKFMKYDFFVNARKGMRSTPHTCFRCGRKFNEKEWIYLGVIKKQLNKIFCESCGEHIRTLLDDKK